MSASEDPIAIEYVDLTAAHRSVRIFAAYQVTRGRHHDTHEHFRRCLTKRGFEDYYSTVGGGFIVCSLGRQTVRPLSACGDSDLAHNPDPPL